MGLLLPPSPDEFLPDVGLEPLNCICGATKWIDDGRVRLRALSVPEKLDIKATIIYACGKCGEHVKDPDPPPEDGFKNVLCTCGHDIFRTGNIVQFKTKKWAGRVKALLVPCGEDSFQCSKCGVFLDPRTLAYKEPSPPAPV